VCVRVSTIFSSVCVCVPSTDNWLPASTVHQQVLSILSLAVFLPGPGSLVVLLAARRPSQFARAARTKASPRDGPPNHSLTVTTHHSTEVKSRPRQRSSRGRRKGRTDHRSPISRTPLPHDGRQSASAGAGSNGHLRKFHPSRGGWIPGARAGERQMRLSGRAAMGGDAPNPALGSKKALPEGNTEDLHAPS
jgi:hypothetical protein